MRSILTVPRRLVLAIFGLPLLAKLAAAAGRR
jgi:hypothetical protein